jgi:hypothetical protein
MLPKGTRELTSKAKRAVEKLAAEGRKKRAKGTVELAEEARKRVEKKRSR